MPSGDRPFGLGLFIEQDCFGVCDVEETPVLKPARPKPTRRTPIERFVEDGTTFDTRRSRWEASQVEAGFVRTTLRCHRDDLEKLKAYSAKLLKKRQKSDDD